MAGNVIKVGVEVSDNGTASKTVKNIKDISTELKEVDAGAKRASAALSSATTPARASTSKAKSTKTSAASPSTPDDYNTERGLVGTGAEARDFGKQASGLGGLVRVYATFAANIYAASAAFSALSKAADTTNMVQGLRQLGASSGVNLGSTAKDLVRATDGALSLRDAMEATTKVVSAGLGVDQVARLGNVAKQASQALGLNLPDAVSRLSRGITKLEPELLDELGIFIKIGDTSANYARSIGKSALALTDFERRQAFANAVLTQAETKFGKIKLDANPYAKLSASMADAASSGLQLVNKVLAPIVDFLSSSPTALLGVFTAIGVTLLKQALPVLNDYRTQLEDTAKATAARSAETADIAKKIAQESATRNLDLAKKNVAAAAFEAQKKVSLARETAELQNEVAQKAQRALTQGADAAFKDKKSKMYQLLQQDPLSITDKDVSKLSSVAKGFETKGLTDQAKAVRDTISLIDTAKNTNIEAGKAAVIAEEEKQKAAKTTAELIEKEQAALAKKSAWYSADATAQRRANADRASAVRNNLIAIAAEDTEVKGLGSSMSSLKKSTMEAYKAGDLGGAVMGKLRVATTLTSGAISSMAVASSSLLASLGPIMALVGIVIAGFSLLSSYLSNNTKEVEKFSASTEKLNSAADTLKDTMSALYDKPSEEFISIESINSRSTALAGLTASIKEVTSTFEKAKQAEGWFEKALSSIGFDSVTKDFTNALAPAITEGISAIPEGPARDELKQKLRSILKIKEGTELTTETIKVGISLADNKALIGQQINDALAASSKPFAEATKAQLEYKAALASTQTAYSALLTSLQDNSPITKLGSSLISSGFAMADAFKNPISQLTTLKDIVNDVNKLGLFSPKAQADLLSNRDRINKLTAEVAEYEKTIKKAEDAAAKYRAAGKGAPLPPEVPRQQTVRGGPTPSATGYFDQQIKSATSSKVTAEKELSTISSKFKDIFSEPLTKGIALVSQSLTNAQNAAGITISKAILSGVSGPGAATLQNELKKRELANQLSLIDAMYKLTVAQQDATLASELATKTQQIVLLKQNLTPSDQGAIQTLLTTMQDVEQTQKARQEIAQGKMGPKEFAALGMETQRMLASMFSAFIGKRTQETKIQGEMAAGNIETKKLETIAQQQEVAKTKQYQIDLNNLRAEGLKLQDSSAVILNKESLLLAQQATLKSQSIADDKRTLELRNEISATEERVSEALVSKDKGTRDNAEAAINAKKIALVREVALQSQKLAILQQQQAIELVSRDFAIQREEAERASVSRQAKADLGSVELEIAKQRLDYAQSLGGYTEADIAQSQKKLEIAQQALALSNEQARLDEDLAAKKRDIEERAQKSRAALPGAGTEEDDATSGVEAVDAQAAEAISRVTQAYDAQKLVLTLRNQKILEGIDLANREKLALSGINEVTNALAGGFGNLGAAIGGAVSAIATLGFRSDELATAQLKERKEFEQAAAKKGEAYLESADYIKDVGDLEQSQAKKSAKLQLDGTIATLGATKKMFGEKTAAYKLIGGIEKALHIAKLAMAVKELIFDGLYTAQMVSTSGARAVANGQEAVTKTLAGLPPPYNFVAGAAMALYVASIIGKSIGRGGGGFQMSSEQRQETQGTGYTYDSSGKKVETGLGVFGDPTAKGDAITKSLGIIADTSVEGITFSNSTVKLLQDIKVNTGKFAASLYGQTGFSGKLGFDIPEFSKGGGLISKIFGGGTSQSISGTGLQFTGNLASLATGEGVMGYADVQKTKKGGMFRSNKTWTETVYKELTGEATSAIASVIRDSQDLLLDLAGKLGKNSVNVLNTLATVDISKKLDLTNMTLEQKEKEITAYITEVLSKGTVAIFGNIVEQYRKSGEDATSTVVRVLDANEKVNASLKSMGKASIDAGLSITGAYSGVFAALATKLGVGDMTYTKSDEQRRTESIAISESLVEKAGGVDKYLELVSKYTDKFLTDEQKQQIAKEGLNARLLELNRLDIGSKEEYIEAVSKSADASSLASDAGRQLNVDLLELAPAFDAVYGSTTKVLTSVELLASENDQLGKIYTLLGKQSKTLELQRSKELDALDSRLRGTQKYIYALEDEASSRSKLLTMRDKEKGQLESTINALDGYINSLSTYKTTLLQGDKSLETPTQKYNRAKAEAQRLAGIVTRVATTDAEKSAQKQALDKLPAASDSFLEASKVLFASSATYQEDLNSVLGTIEASSALLATQKTDAEQQLDYLKSSTSFLDSIASSTETTATLLVDYLAAVSNTSIARAGASETVQAATAQIVAEAIPVVTVQNSPAQEQTVMRLDDVIAELKSIKEDQLKSTGDLLVITAQTAQTIKNAVTEALAAAMTSSTWQQKQTITIV